MEKEKMAQNPGLEIDNMKRYSLGGVTMKEEKHQSELSSEPRVRMFKKHLVTNCLILSRVTCSIDKKSLETKNSFSVVLEMEG